MELEPCGSMGENLPENNSIMSPISSDRTRRKLSTACWYFCCSGVSDLLPDGVKLKLIMISRS